MSTTHRHRLSVVMPHMIYVVSACRWHVSGDTVDFADSLVLDLEIGPDAPELLERYRTVAFLYR